MAKIIDKKGQKSLLIKFSSTHSLCLFTLTQILYLIIKFQISRTIVTSICYGGSKLPNYFYSTLLRSCVNIEFYEKRGPKQTLNCTGCLWWKWPKLINYCGIFLIYDHMFFWLILIRFNWPFYEIKLDFWYSEKKFSAYFGDISKGYPLEKFENHHLFLEK